MKHDTQLTREPRYPIDADPIPDGSRARPPNNFGWTNRRLRWRFAAALGRRGFRTPYEVCFHTITSLTVALPT